MDKEIKADDMKLIVNYDEPDQREVSGLSRDKIPVKTRDNPFTTHFPGPVNTDTMSVEEFNKHFKQDLNPGTFEGTFNADCSILKEFICPGKPEDYENEISFHIISITKNKKDVEIMTNMEGTGLQLVIFHEPSDMFINAFCRAMWDKEPFVLCF